MLKKKKKDQQTFSKFQRTYVRFSQVMKSQMQQVSN